jgi:hypothetical protein
VERVRTPMGEQAALKIRLSVSEKSRAVGKNIAIWISQDPRHLPVKLSADLPVGSFNLVLREAK